MAINFDHQLNKIVTSTSNIDFDITGSIKLPVGTTAQRPGTAAGEIRFNSSTGKFEGYNGTSWVTMGLSNASINDLNDVDTATAPPADGQVLRWSSGLGQWVPADSSSGLTEGDAIAFAIALGGN
jgi:hypothetical protein